MKERLVQKNPGLLLDLREPADFESGHIAGSINIPLGLLMEPQQFLTDFAERPVYLICSTGKRAYQGAELLCQSGFNDFIVIAGGLLSWRVLGFPLVRK